MTVHDALVWCSQQVGKPLDFDGQYGAQCVDFFNFYYQHITGRNPYADGYSVPSAKDLWDVPTDLFDKIPNNPNDPNQLPPPGSILIYDGGLQGSDGNGHVAVADYDTTVQHAHVYDQNWGGMFVRWQYHMWTGHEIGWLVFKGFEAVAPPPPVPPPAPAPVPEPQPEPTPEPTPEPAPEPVVVVTPPVPPPKPPVITVTPVTPVAPPMPAAKGQWSWLVNFFKRLFKKG